MHIPTVKDEDLWLWTVAVQYICNFLSWSCLSKTIAWKSCSLERQWANQERKAFESFRPTLFRKLRWSRRKLRGQLQSSAESASKLWQWTGRPSWSIVLTCFNENITRRFRWWGTVLRNCWPPNDLTKTTLNGSSPRNRFWAGKMY